MAGSGPKKPSDPSLDATVLPDDLAATVAPDDVDATVLPDDLAATVAPDDVDASTAAAPDKKQVVRRGPSSRPGKTGPGRESVLRLEKGAELGRYVILELLGSGGMGAVYAAYDPELDRKVALKVIHPTGESADQLARQRLVTEAQALARLSHPNVVAVYDVGTVDGDVHIAMEFVAGRTLGKWIEEDKPDVAAIVEVFAEAGRGLAAAHDAGLVHRDFKPDNVIIGDDGRVRVIDFGVAHEASERQRPLDIKSSHKRDKTLSSSTALVGTPSYMAPEQFVGTEVDARTDQFSFGIALYQAISGQLPFAGETIPELAQNVGDGAMRPMPDTVEVPATVSAAIVRAMATAKDERFSSMDDLLEALCPPTVTRGTRLAWLAIPVLVAALAIPAGFKLFAATPDPCVGFEDELTGVWDDSRRDAMGKALGQEVAPLASVVLDRYTDEWLKRKKASCRATLVTEERSHEVMRATMRCLDGHLRDIDSVVTVLSAGGEELSEQAVEIASSLPALIQCDNAAAADVAAPPNVGAELEAALETRFTEAKADKAKSDYPKALEGFQSVIAESHELGWKALEGRAMTELGKLHLSMGAPKDARDTLFKALELAALCGDDYGQARAWIALIVVEATGTREFDEALRWVGQAKAAVARTDGDLLLEALLAYNTAIALNKFERFEEALELQQKAKALFEHAHGPDHLMVIRTRSAIGSTLKRLGRMDEGIAELEATLAAFEKLLGPDNPVLVTVLNNLANGLVRADRYDDARPLYERAIEIRRKALGDDNPKLAVPLLNLALIAQYDGNWDENQRLWEWALRARMSLGEEHPNVNRTWMWYGLYLSNRGESAEALKIFDKVAESWRSRYGDKDERYGWAVANQCAMYRVLGQTGKAKASCARAVAIGLEAAPESAEYAWALVYTAQLLNDQGDLNKVTENLEIADGLVAKLGEPDVELLASIAYERARLRWAQGDKSAADGSAREAVRLWSQKGATFQHFVDNVERWRQERK